MEINPSASSLGFTRDDPEFIEGSFRINGERGRTIKNLKKAAARISRAIKKRENIIIYGDADLDGATSIIILKEALNNLAQGNFFPQPTIYFPDREREGYGITKIGLNYLKKFKPALLIALDLGISNFKEIKLAKKIGFEVVIIDHHETLDRLPEASIIVDPKQPGDKYPFKGLATAGIVYKLVQLLLKEKLSSLLKKSFLELVALATVADLMPREEENQAFIEEGFSSIEKSFRPGIKTLFETEDLQKYENLNQKISKIISILNVRDVENGFPAPFRLLVVSRKEEAKLIIKKLLAKSEERREKIKEIIEEVEKRFSEKKEVLIFEGDFNWELAFLSSVASFFCQKYQKPAFIFKKLEKESQGTVRTPVNINGVTLMKKCKKYLITYGGHSQASGFRIKNENLEKFKKCLIANYKPI